MALNKLMKYVARAALNVGGAGVLGDVVFEFLPELARKAWGWWSGETDEKQRIADVQQLTQMSQQEAVVQAQAVVQAEAQNVSEEIQLELISYLTQMPDSIRQSQRRPADPSGRTVSPGLSLSRATDLVPLLPVHLPRYKCGDCPIPGVAWELQELLGSGGFGEVWKAYNPDFPSLVSALKFCLDPQAVLSLRNEAKVLNYVMQQGRHPGIVTLRQVHVQADWLCLEYEYVAGGDLCGLIQEMHHESPASPYEVAQMMMLLLNPIRYAHKLNPPIVHRDLKPANVLVERGHNNGIELRVTDFGIGGLSAQQALEDAQFTRTQSSQLVSSLRGSCTPLYASKQQQNGEAPDPRDDVHALGVMWFQFLTGDLSAGPGPDWREEMSDLNVPEEMISLLARCLASKPERRLENADALAERLEKLIPQGSPAPVIKEPEPEPQPIAKKPKPEPEREPESVSAPAPAPRASARLPKNLKRELVNSLKSKLILIPAGSFPMGSPETEHMRAANEGPVHEVEITRPFYFAMHPVTQAEYLEVMGTNPSWFTSRGQGKAKVRGVDHLRLPVECVSWEDAVELCHRLTEREKHLRPGWEYRLPTEAEWEHVAKNGTGGYRVFAYGDSLTSKQANFNGIYPYQSDERGPHLERPSPVGSYPPSELRICDLHGNVWEWCLDWFDEKYYANSSERDPQGPTRGDEKVLRGGSWCDLGWNCRSACRYHRSPTDRDSDTGFRVVLTPPTE